MQNTIARRFDEAAAVLGASGAHLSERMVQAAKLLIACLRADGAVYLFGNGGSAADAQHFAGELVGSFLKRNRRPLRAAALTCDPSVISAVANDFGFETVFARQLQALGRKGDLAIGLSTSGNSPNVLAALQAARTMGIKTIAMTGRGGGKCAALADVLLDVPCDQTPRIQEVHAVLGHILCELAESALTG